VQRGELVRATARGIRENAIERADLETERAPGRRVVALEALRLAREFPGLAVHRDRLAANDARRVGSGGVPLVRVARPVAIVVAHEQSRFDRFAAEREALHEY